ncbi:MAG: YdiU family protein [Pseudomonadota bacterium]
MSPRFSQIHKSLGPAFFDPVKPANFPQHILRYRNQRAAESVGLDGLGDAAWLNHFGRFEPFADGYNEPLALRYHGHQFQVYNPDLGDGRGFLFAQLVDLGDGRILDLGTKGSGQTPYSRAGDGRLTLKGGVREALATAQLEALGVYTSKTLSLIETGEPLQRHDEPSPTRSAVMVRLCHSHIRMGTFQRLAFEEDHEALAALINHCCRHYFPHITATQTAQQADALLAQVVAESARLTAQWMVAGFVHGVLNTDNLNITGESFDYGPYRFLPYYEPGFTAAYFDENGLYAYGRQPQAVHWNLCRLAECLLDLVDRDQLAERLAAFNPTFEIALHEAFTRRLGITLAGEMADAVDAVDAGGSQGPTSTSDHHGANQTLIAQVFRFLKEAEMQPDQFFHDWLGGVISQDRAAGSPDAELYQSSAFADVLEALTPFKPRDEVAAIVQSPAFDRPRPVTLLYNEIEALWALIDRHDDWSGFEAKLADIDQLRIALAPLMADQPFPYRVLEPPAA